MYIFSESKCAWFKTFKTFFIYKSKVVLVDKTGQTEQIHSHNMLLAVKMDSEI